MKYTKEKMEKDNDISTFELFFEFFEEVKLMFSLVKKHIKIFCLLALLGGFIGISYTFISKPVYNAKLTFLVSPEGNRMSTLSGIAGMFGINASPIGSSLERALKLIESDRIVSKALFKSVTINGEKNFIINHFIELENLREEWRDNKDTILEKVSYKKSLSDINGLSFAQRKGLKQIKNIILPENGVGVISKSFDIKSGVIQLEASHENEFFTIEITNAIYEELFDFYMKQSLYSSKNNVDILVKKVDSIKIALNNIQNLTALASDKRLGPSRLTLEKNKVELRNLLVQEQVLIIMYGEAQKNLETFKVMSDNETPPLTLMDYPYSPITPYEKSKILFLFFGAIIPSILLLFYYRLKLIYDKSKFVL